jgi:hypothetical protein
LVIVVFIGVCLCLIGYAGCPVKTGCTSIAHRAANLFREIFFAGHGHAANGARFQMLPDQLVGIVIWRIRRRKGQAQFSTQSLHESTDFFRTMGRATIDDQKDFALGIFRQALQEFDEDIGVDAPLIDDHESHMAARGDRRNQTHAVAGACHLHDGRIAFCPSCAPRVMIGTDVRRIAEIDVSFLLLRQSFDLRVILLQPLFDERFVAFANRHADSAPATHTLFAR